jgi:hypothetical protein
MYRLRHLASRLITDLVITESFYFSKAARGSSVIICCSTVKVTDISHSVVHWYLHCLSALGSEWLSVASSEQLMTGCVFGGKCFLSDN